VISIPPYYLSSKLVTWLLKTRVQCAVLILQREFAERLVAPVESDNYGWLTVIAAHEVQTDLLDDVPKTMFYPAPEVDSVIVRMSRWETAPFQVHDEDFFNRLVRWLFTQRNKRISNALVPLLRNVHQLSRKEAEELASSVQFGERRARELSPREFGELTNALAT
jgi:16S rRNA (adenine1518-N6/adenine1519-N6)-dimethyltransferase